MSIKFLFQALDYEDIETFKRIEYDLKKVVRSFIPKA